MTEQYHCDAERKCEVGQHARAAFAEVLALEIEILEHVIGEPAFVLNIMPVEEHRKDQKREADPIPKRVRISPDLGARTHQQQVEEAKRNVDGHEPIRRAIRTRNVRAVDAMDPDRLQVQEDEQHVADVRDRENEVVRIGVR